MSKEIVEKARENMRGVLDVVAEKIKQNRVPTEDQQLQEYMAVRGDPFKMAALVVGKIKAFERTAGRPLGKDPLTAAREYERQMEILLKQRS